MTNWDLSQECKNSSTQEIQYNTNINRAKGEKKHKIISTDTEKAFHKIQNLFMRKNIQQTSNRKDLA